MSLGPVVHAEGPVRVLLVDDDPETVADTVPALEACDRLEVSAVDDPVAALEAHAESPFDCIVTEFEFDGSTGFDALLRLRELPNPPPVILFTRLDSVDVVREAFDAGVADVVEKPPTEAQLAVLAYRISKAVAAARQSTELDELHAWVRVIADQSLVGLYVIRDGRIEFVNEYLSNLLGYDTDEVVGRPITDFIVEQDRAIVDESLKSREHGSVESMSYTVRVSDRTGGQTTLEITGQRTVVDGESVVVGTAMDVTARLESERLLRRSERLTRQIISSLPDMVFISEPTELDIVYINDQFESVWGRDVSLLYEDPRSFLELVHVDDRDQLRRAIDEMFADIRDGGVDKQYEYEYEFRFIPEGSETIRWANARAVPLLDENGDVTNILGVMSDLTERISHERELAQQNARLDAFARVLSHDIRGPLSVAQGRLELARELDDGSHLDYVERAHQRITDVVEDVLSLARDGRSILDAEEVSLADAAATAWEMCSPNAGHVRCEVGELPVVEADESRATRLFENLFRNALQHGRSDPDDASTASDDSELVIRVGALPSHRGFFVEDNGPGIPASIRDHVFDSGFSTKDGDGNGLGLGIVRQIVDSHGWVIRVVDGGSGARFEVLFDPVGEAGATD
ncbi:signal-transducing histidine kinase-like protein [Haloferax gibbonsii ATCC 33959]|uniref:histidine kinase n=1 Tax=Haloferax gibbonsii (strain ATCC 33959 / DSM 4427 / JCM 8863 / NBRC 102184 / NCIMB 2188 / Ma 2.38) TaxID=1227459 RepID=M0HH43_HALGM|nr:PAS domain S-box protein [Haloferax gibbonsii]ELZ83865.1 signal-transducing histidine kinase-like protein [Haloferax gibbonsii ATCC 33959]